jgi:hypothetical protein
MKGVCPMIPIQNEPHPIFAANDEYLSHMYGLSPGWNRPICWLAEARS